jgi:hypothetical protein
MFYKVAAADNINILMQIVAYLLHQGWAVAGVIASDDQLNLQAMT